MAYLTLTVVLVFISILGILINGYILTGVLLTRQVVSANNILLLHLGALDSLIGVLFLSFALPDLYDNEWLFKGAPCVLHGFLFTLLHSMILWTICGLNCDRFYAIAAPLHYSHLVNPKKILVSLGAGWFMSLALCVPPLFTIAPYTYIPGLGACAPDFSLGSSALWYSAVYTAFTLLLPATLIICCNFKILMIARYHRHRIASAIFEVALSAQVTITHQRNPFFVPTVTAPAAGGPKFRGRSAISTVLQILGSFMVLYVPYYGLILWESSSNTLVSATKAPFDKLHPHLFSVASTLLTCSPTINGFIYGIRNKTLRKTFKNYWRKKLTKCEVNQEIQARTPSTCGSRRPSITPLGFFTKPVFQRRLSEALLDVHKVVGGPRESKMKRIVSELAWRPNSTTGLNLSPCEDRLNRLSQTASCNTLQVPTTDSDELSFIQDEEIKKKKNEENALTKTSPRNFILQKLFGPDIIQINKKVTAVQKVLDHAPKESPRITITRAFSEDSDKTHSSANSPAKEAAINKKHSFSATTLIERKWKKLKQKDPDIYVETSAKSSDSSDNSDYSSGRIYMAIDVVERKQDVEVVSEDQLLLSWNEHKKYSKGEDVRKRPSLVKQSIVQTQEIVL